MEFPQQSEYIQVSDMHELNKLFPYHCSTYNNDHFGYSHFKEKKDSSYTLISN